jgi:phage terminase Nu1 subunit (DNA packaging protein)|tara:strand:- start:70 stop:609 length:540 start_codon:yes stop_codon:yes gene_type:complete
MSDAGNPTYPVSTISKLLLLTERRVQQLVKEGIIPKTERNRYELAPAVQGYIRFLQERMVGNTAAPIDYQNEKSRLVRIQADKAQIELDHMNEALIETSEVAKEWEAILGDMKSKILSVPTKAAPLVRDETSTSVIMEILQSFIDETLHELSNYGKNIESASDPIEWDEDTEAAAEIHG